MMQRLLWISFFLAGCFPGITAMAAGLSPEDRATQTLLEKREVVASIPFEHNDYKLSPASSTELEKQFSVALAKCGSRGIIRLEGFSAPGEIVGPREGVALLRAKEAWNYLQKKNAKERERMFMTWFDGEQSLSTERGGRLEIAVYENPFAAEMERAVKSKGVQ